jgi:hypothetical protein
MFSICRTALPVTARVLAGDVKASVAVVVTLLIIAYYYYYCLRLIRS